MSDFTTAVTLLKRIADLSANAEKFDKLYISTPICIACKKCFDYVGPDGEVTEDRYACEGLPCEHCPFHTPERLSQLVKNMEAAIPYVKLKELVVQNEKAGNKTQEKGTA